MARGVEIDDFADEIDEGQVCFASLYMAAALAIDAAVWRHLADTIVQTDADPRLVGMVTAMAGYNALHSEGLEYFDDEIIHIIEGLERGDWIALWAMILRAGADDRGPYIGLDDVRKCHALRQAVNAKAEIDDWAEQQAAANNDPKDFS